jgi:hypothetical protein
MEKHQLQVNFLENHITVKRNMFSDSCPYAVGLNLCVRFANLVFIFEKYWQ